MSKPKSTPPPKSSPALEPKVSPLSVRVAELEAENATLKEMVAGEQSARVALERVIGDQISDILTLLREREVGK